MNWANSASTIYGSDPAGLEIITVLSSRYKIDLQLIWLSHHLFIVKSAVSKEKSAVSKEKCAVSKEKCAVSKALYIILI